LVAIVVQAKREVLLRAYRNRLRPDELEDCYGQATFELLRSVKNGRRFAGREHLANTLEQRFVSRVRDQMRATGGRSPAEAGHESALLAAGDQDAQIEVVDLRAESHELVALRMDLEQILRVAPYLTVDQRLVIASQVSGVDCAELCRHTGWSSEKYRKVAQRGRARLRALMAESPVGGSSEGGVPCGAARSE
jgi:DNA-directed RNA polymerase specialized sigma24 family protein